MDLQLDIRYVKIEDRNWLEKGEEERAVFKAPSRGFYQLYRDSSGVMLMIRTSHIANFLVKAVRERYGYLLWVSNVSGDFPPAGSRLNQLEGLFRTVHLYGGK